MVGLPDCQTLVILDIEYTVWDESTPERPWRLHEIVQIGMVALKRDTLSYVDEFSCFIRPALYPALTPRFQEVTNISQAEVDEKGTGLSQAFENAESFIDSLPGSAQLVSNGVDGMLLQKNADVLNVSCPECLAESINISSYIRENIPQYDYGHHCSGDLAELVGHPLSGSKHDAIYDVKSIAAALRHIEGLDLTE